MSISDCAGPESNYDAALEAEIDAMTPPPNVALQVDTIRRAIRYLSFLPANTTGASRVVADLHRLISQLETPDNA